MSLVLPDHLRPLFHGFLHEIRNPMSAILTASSLLAEPELLDKNDFAAMVKVMNDETRRMDRVVKEFDRFLNIAPPEIEKFDLAALLRQQINELRDKKVLDKNIRIADDLPETLLVAGDRSQIDEAMRAILLNAAQALPGSTPPQLALCPEESESQIVFLICDSGEGFTDESTRRAFEPFYSSRPGAIGLGLPRALALLQNSEGSLEILLSKKENPGACLRVTLNK